MLDYCSVLRGGEFSRYMNGDSFIFVKVPSIYLLEDEERRSFGIVND